MSDIDAEKLEEALTRCDDSRATWYGRIVLEAARAHLATLPRYKEVEVVQWVVIERDGTVETAWSSQKDAESRARCFAAGHSVVRLTGTAKVKVTP